MRKGKARKRYLLPDPRFKDTLVTRFVHDLMMEGKKNTAYKIFYGAIDKVSEKTTEEGLDVWKKALDNVMPPVEVRSRRVGGATYQIPQEIRPSRKLSLGIKWMIRSARDRKGRSMADKLAEEIVAAYKEEGAAYKKKEDTLRMAEANKAFSHFRF